MLLTRSFLLILLTSLCPLILAGVPPLQLESKLSPLTNVLQDRDYQRFWHDHVKEEEKFKGKPQKLIEKLTQGLIPTHYNLFIRPILDDMGNPAERFTAPGIVKISFTCERPTTEVAVHAVEIDISDQYVQIRNRRKVEENVQIRSRVHEREDSVYRITLEEPLDVNKEYTLTIAFTARVSRDRLNGLYLSNYTDPGTKEVKYIAVTQFESVSARKAFPCLDEPDLKATFDVSIGRKSSYNSISNMKLLKSEPIMGLNGWVWDHYETTEKMSTYLIAFVVSDFTAATASPELFGGKPVKTWARKRYIDAGNGDYAAQTAARVLSFYEGYFDTPYPLPKMDSVAIPHFQAGAMENWGANTYRERLLLHFGVNTTEADRYSIASVISHELAHQNFGDLVTCKRWTHLWLNEGFASYVSYLGVNKVAPEFRPFDLFYTEIVRAAMKADVAQSAHPLVNDTVQNQISTGDFDSITYKKGGSLIRMMQGFLGRSALQQGLRQYLHKHQFSNAETEDLFNELNAVADLGPGMSNVTVKEVMDTWAYKTGYPLVRVTRGRAGRSLSISQERFRLNKINSGSSNKTEEDDHDDRDVPLEHWWVPLSIKFSNNASFEDTHPDLWLGKDVLSKQWPLVRASGSLSSPPENFDWLVVNPNLGGYYRVLYDEDLTRLLQQQLIRNHSVFPAAARARLIDDYFSAADANYVPLASALGFTKHLGEETDYSVWTTAFLNLKRIYNMFRLGRSLVTFKGFFRPMIVQALERIGWEQKSTDKGMEVLLRSHLLDWACNFEYFKCTQMAKRLFTMWMGSPLGVNPIPVDIQPVVYCTAVATSDDEEVWNYVWRRYQESEGMLEKFKLISALCCSKDPTKLQFLMDEALNNTSRITKIDASVALQRLAASSIGNELVFGKIKKDFGSIVSHFGGTDQIAYALSTLSLYWNDPERLEEFKEFVGIHADSFSPVMKLLRGSINIVEDNIAWLKKFETDINSWMQGHRGVEPGI